MKPEDRRMERVDLDNGLSVHFSDQSREVAADRRQVQLLIRIPIEVDEIYFAHCEDSRKACEAFTAAVGKTIYFQIEKIRNFVDLKETQEALESLKKEFLKANLDYISRPHFARKFVLKSYHEWREQQHLKERYTQHLRST